jgi:hypothetical protein
VVMKDKQGEETAKKEGKENKKRRSIKMKVQ